MDYRQAINTRIKSLIDCEEIDCYEAACAIINMSRPKGAPQMYPGTISRRFKMNREWPTTEWMALERAAGRYPVSAFIATLAIEDEAGDQSFSHLRTMKESHECVMAQAIAETSDDEEDILQAIEETEDVRITAVSDLKALRAKLKAVGGSE